MTYDLFLEQKLADLMINVELFNQEVIIITY